MDLLLSYHDSKAGGGHLGIKRTYEAIKQKFYFTEMYNCIQNYILSCVICQRVKRNAQARNAPLQPLPIQDVFARWHMDILAGMPKNTRVCKVWKQLLKEKFGLCQIQGFYKSCT
jgi:hypothetical protein